MMETTNEELVERNTTEELRRRLIGRTLHELHGDDRRITGVDYFPYTGMVTMRFGTDHVLFTIKRKDAERLLAGEEITYTDSLGIRLSQCNEPAGESACDQSWSDDSPGETEIEGDVPPCGVKADGQDVYTRERLEGLLVGRELKVEHKVIGGKRSKRLKVDAVLMDDGDDCAVLRDEDRSDGALVDLKDMGDLLAGKAITSYSRYSETKVTLLPRERPRLPKKWENRWWQVFFHYYTTDNGDTCLPDDIAALADEAIETAMRHLEGE